MQLTSAVDKRHRNGFKKNRLHASSFGGSLAIAGIHVYTMLKTTASKIAKSRGFGAGYPHPR